MAKTTSEASARALGEEAHLAPFASRGSAFSLRRLKTVAANPAVIRCPTMLDPMTPVPIQPIRVLPGAIVGSDILTVKECERRVENYGPKSQYIGHEG